MEFKQLNTDWNAHPNGPDPEVSVIGSNVTISFFLNNYLYNQFKEDDKGVLTFKNCSRYSFNSMNDEGYYMGKYRFKHTALPWGYFYLLTDADTNFSKEIMLDSSIEKEALNHYIFFFRDNTFECMAEDFELKFET